MEEKTRIIDGHWSVALLCEIRDDWRRVFEVEDGDDEKSNSKSVGKGKRWLVLEE